MSQVRKYITDQRILDTIQVFIDEFTSGLGLGSQVSQVLSLLAASPIDHMIKDELRFKYFIRYMDDGLVIHHDRKQLEKLLERIKEKSDELHLTLNLKKTRIVSIKRFTFLKKRFMLEDNGKIVTKLAKSSIVRTRRKLKKYPRLCDCGRMNIENVEQSYQSWRGYALQYNSYKTVQKMDEYYNKAIRLITNGGDKHNE